MMADALTVGSVELPQQLRPCPEAGPGDRDGLCLSSPEGRLPGCLPPSPGLAMRLVHRWFHAALGAEGAQHRQEINAFYR